MFNPVWEGFMRSFVIAGLLIISSPTFAADQFDLDCTAKKQNERFRVDLVRGEWCFGKCEIVQKLAGVTSGMLTLAEHEPTYPGDHTSYNRINRVTGEWEWYYSGGQNIEGRCEVAPFSGFPEANRKF